MTVERTFASKSAEETRQLGERMGALLGAGNIVLLSGELGAGKTVFVQGIARGLGFEGSVSSKSFVLLGEYAGRVKLYHADLYRLEAAEEVAELALDEISADGVLVVEWPERAGEDVLPKEHVRVEFAVTGEEERMVQISSVGERAKDIIGRLSD
jgi:tRNA threonylcarbamoyladenosine biosynthesis protein TsaE